MVPIQKVATLGLTFYRCMNPINLKTPQNFKAFITKEANRNGAVISFNMFQVVSGCAWGIVFHKTTYNDSEEMGVGPVFSNDFESRPKDAACD